MLQIVIGDNVCISSSTLTIRLRDYLKRVFGLWFLYAKKETVFYNERFYKSLLKGL